MSASDVRIYNEGDIDRIETALHTNEDRSYNKRFTMRELTNGISDLPPDKTYGKDEVHNLFIRNLPENKL